MLPIKDIVEKIRITVKDTDEEQNSYKDEELLMYVNAGIRFIRRIVADLNPLILADYHKKITVSGGDAFLDLESNISRVLMARCEGNRLVPVNYFELHANNLTGMPAKYAVYGTHGLVLSPIPDHDTEIDVLAINDSGELNIGDATPFNTDLDDLVIEYAVLRCGMSDRFSMAQETTLFSSIVSQISSLITLNSECTMDGY